MINPSDSGSPGVTRSEYWNAIKAGNRTHVRMTFVDQEYNDEPIVFDDSNVDINEGLILTEILIGDDEFKLGRTISTQIQTCIMNIDDLINYYFKLRNAEWSGEFTLELGVEINNETKWVKVGIFTFEPPKNVYTGYVKVTANDRMRYFDVPADNFLANLTYPITLQGIYDALCEHVCVPNVSGNELPNVMSRQFLSAPADMSGHTCRDILSWIAEACGCFAKIDNKGRCKLFWIDPHVYWLILSDNEVYDWEFNYTGGSNWDTKSNYTWNDLDKMTWDSLCGYKEKKRIDRIVLTNDDKQINYRFPYGNNIYLIDENPFLRIYSQDDVEQYIVPLYNRLFNLGGLIAYSVDCIGNWCSEAGDFIQVTLHSPSYRSVVVPVFSRTMRWNGAIEDEYEATDYSFGQNSYSGNGQQNSGGSSLSGKEIKQGNIVGETDANGMYVSNIQTSKHLVSAYCDDPCLLFAYNGQWAFMPIDLASSTTALKAKANTEKIFNYYYYE